MTDVTVDDIRDRLLDEVSEDITDDTIESHITEFTGYIPGSDTSTVLDGVVSKIANDREVPKEDIVDESAQSSSGTADLMKLDDIDESIDWASVEVEVVDLWDNDTESIAQVGLVADDSGRIKFTSWSKSNLMLLSEGSQYRLENVSVSEYQGNLDISLNSSTEITMLTEDEEVEINTTITFEGSCVSVQDGSGLIERCTVDGCNRALSNGRCREHGDVDGEHDLRMKLVVDNGDEVRTVICGRELSEELTGMELEDAKELARESLDKSAPAQQMVPEVLGKYFRITGVPLGDNIGADTVETSTDYPDPEELLIRARSL